MTLSQRPTPREAGEQIGRFIEIPRTCKLRNENQLPA